METIRQQIKDACINNGIDYETACLIADELGFDNKLGDLQVNLLEAVKKGVE